MTYALKLAKRMRDYLAGSGGLPDLEEKKMFGGVAFMIRGNMACGIHGDVKKGIDFASSLPPK